MFQIPNDPVLDKGLFTFYREQAELESQLSESNSLQNNNFNSFILNNQKSLILNNSKLKNTPRNFHTNNSKFKIEKSIQQILPENLIHKKSFDELNKAHIRKLSMKNERLINGPSKQVGSEVVVIKKGSVIKPKEDLRLEKINTRYQMQEGYFLKQKIFDPLQQSLLAPPDDTVFVEKIFLDQIKSRRKSVKTQSIKDHYFLMKSKLENELILNNEAKRNPNSLISPRFEVLKKVEPEFDELNHYPRSNSSISYTLNHKRIPPKVLASILKSQNNEVVRHIRNQLLRQKSQKTKIKLQKNHSFIEYGSHDYQKSGMDKGKINEKQRRLINILNKFNKKQLTT